MRSRTPLWSLGLSWILVSGCGGERAPATSPAASPPTPAAPEPVAPAAPAESSAVVEPAPSAPPPPAEPAASEPAAPTAGPSDPNAPWGTRPGEGQGFGNGHGRLSGGHHTAPMLRQGQTTVTGRLPPEVVQRIVRQNFGRFRLCYENGLRKNQKLGGRITIAFTIDRSGAVSKTSDGGSDLPDAEVIACVSRGFGNLSFPRPEGGEVTVLFPILFAPGDDAPPPRPASPPPKPKPAPKK